MAYLLGVRKFTTGNKLQLHMAVFDLAIESRIATHAFK